jgi:RNA polymerase sigma factor FliA
MLDRPRREMTDAWVRYKESGDPDARDELIEEYLPLTRYVAGQMSRRLPPTVEYDDLVSYGTLGLLDAIEKYDLDKGVKFSTYAVSRIRGAVLDELRSLDWVPRSVRTKARSIDNATSSLSNRLGRMPTPVEMSAELGIEVSELSALVFDSVASPTVALDSGQDDESIVDMMADPNSDDPLATQVSAEAASIVASVVADLDPRQRRILALYCVEELTLSQIGELFGVTESRVCQLHTRAVASIQEKLELRGAGVATK